MWTCPRCGEANEPQFTACWKCARADEEEIRRLPETPRARRNAEWPAIFGDPPRILPAPEEPSVAIDPDGRVRCPTCGDVFRVRPREGGP
jgi:hypothetical protein